jgi:peroxiredoxin
VDAARDEFAARGCSVLVVSQAKPEFLAHYLTRRTYGVAFASDPERVAYHAFGLERTPFRTFLRPRVLLGYFAGMFRGYAPRKPYQGEDVLQLGGDFILGAAGRIEFAYRSRDPADRPAVSRLLAALPSPPPMPGNRTPDAPPR